MSISPIFQKRNRPLLGEPWVTLTALALMWLGLVAVAGFSLHLNGAFEREFDGNADEAAHMMTALLVHDYLVSDTEHTAIAYAQQHYLAYPKSAFGAWPPLFHLLAGSWFVVFEPSRGSAILLMAVLLALTAVVTFAGLRRELGEPAAALLALIVVSCPLLVSVHSALISDALLVPLALAATWCFARFLATHTLSNSLWFGVFSGLAFLTKYNALELAFLPFVGIAITGQWRLWRNPKLWAAPAMVLLIASPWYLHNLSMVQFAADMGSLGFPSMLEACVDNLRGLGRFVGPLGGLFAAVGLLVEFMRPRCSPKAAALAGLIIGVWAMHSFVYPLVDLRYLLPAVPALFYFAASGLVATARHLPWPVPFAYRKPALALCALLLAVVSAGESKPIKGWRGLTARLREIAPTNVMLVSGGGEAEGAMITEMALGDPHRQDNPDWTVLRASKMLASSTWMNGNYRMRVSDPEEVLRLLKKWGVSVVAVDCRRNGQPHERLLLSSLGQPGSTWREDIGANGVRVFIDPRAARREPTPMEVDLSFTLGRKLHFSLRAD